jgi:hypothetical protein
MNCDSASYDRRLLSQQIRSWLSLNSEAQTYISVMKFSEMSILCFLIAFFLVTGVLSAKRILNIIRNPLEASHSDSANRILQQIIATVVVVFTTFLPRAAFSTMEAVSGTGQNFQESRCINICSDVATLSCQYPYNQFVHLFYFLQLTPEFQIFTILVASPLAHLVALWGMTSERMLQKMKAGTALVNVHLLDQTLITRR